MNVRPNAVAVATTTSFFVICLAIPAVAEGSDEPRYDDDLFRPANTRLVIYPDADLVPAGIGSQTTAPPAEAEEAEDTGETEDTDSTDAAPATTEPAGTDSGAPLSVADDGYGTDLELVDEASQGVGFLSHLDVGVGFSTHPVVAGLLYSSTDKAVDESDLSAGNMNTVGLNTRIELWPAHSRHAGIGAFGTGYIGGMPDGSSSAGAAAGGLGVVGFAGSDRVSALAMFGSEVRLGLQGGGVVVQQDTAGEISSEVAGAAFRYTTHRAGLGIRFGLDRRDRNDLDFWVIADRPYYASGASGRGPIAAFPVISDSSMVLKGGLHMRDALQLGVEFSPRYPSPPAANEVDFESEGTWAVATLGFGLDRRSNSYGRR